jgi:hypothetical protein
MHSTLCIYYSFQLRIRHLVNPFYTSKASHSHSISSATTTSTAFGLASISNFLPSEIKDGLVTTGLTSWLRQEAQKAEYYKRRDQERKAKDAATRVGGEKKRELVWKGKSAARELTNAIPSSTKDVPMSTPPISTRRLPRRHQHLGLIIAHSFRRSESTRFPSKSFIYPKLHTH